jgi:hypothetical protein
MSMPSVCRSEYGGRWRLCVKDGPRRWAKVPGSIRLVQHASSAAHCDALVERNVIEPANARSTCDGPC